MRLQLLLQRLGLARLQRGTRWSRRQLRKLPQLQLLQAVCICMQQLS